MNEKIQKAVTTPINKIAMISNWEHYIAGVKPYCYFCETEQVNPKISSVRRARLYMTHDTGSVTVDKGRKNRPEELILE